MNTATSQKIVHCSSLRRVGICLSGTREYVHVCSDKTSLFSTAMEGGSAGNADSQPYFLHKVIQMILFAFVKWTHRVKPGNLSCALH
jgi:hypothetical protein